MNVIELHSKPNIVVEGRDGIALLEIIIYDLPFDTFWSDSILRDVTKQTGLSESELMSVFGSAMYNMRELIKDTFMKLAICNKEWYENEACLATYSSRSKNGGSGLIVSVCFGDSTNKECFAVNSTIYLNKKHTQTTETNNEISLVLKPTKLTPAAKKVVNDFLNICELSALPIEQTSLNDGGEMLRANFPHNDGKSGSLSVYISGGLIDRQ